MVWRAAQQIIHMDRPCFLYRQFDANDELLYVGLTTDPHQRHLRHRQDSPWAHLIDRTEYEMHPNLWVGGAHESLAIETEGPLYNVVHSADRESARERRKQLEAAS